MRLIRTFLLASSALMLAACGGNAGDNAPKGTNKNAEAIFKLLNGNDSVNGSNGCTKKLNDNIVLNLVNLPGSMTENDQRFEAYDLKLSYEDDTAETYFTVDYYFAGDGYTGEQVEGRDVGTFYVREPQTKGSITYLGQGASKYGSDNKITFVKGDNGSYAYTYYPATDGVSVDATFKGIETNINSTMSAFASFLSSNNLEALF